MGWLNASNGYTLKRGFGMWHLTGFSGVRESYLMDFNGTLEFQLFFNPQQGPPVERLLKIA